MKKQILVTGGAGFIGSHTVLELLLAGYEVTVVDNLINSSEESLRRVSKITDKKIKFHNLNVSDTKKLRSIFQENSFDSVLHFAALKAVGESVAQPLRYYQNNLVSTLSLCEVMQEFGVKKMVFSSSAAVYGNPDNVPVSEDAPLHPPNPYGRSKAMVEQILIDLVATNQNWQVSILRYFNPIGAHHSGLIGEDPSGTPNNLLPYIARVAVGKLQKLSIYGDDYDTADGTGVRDYIHVVDLAQGHVLALQHMPTADNYEVYNLGTGHGHSVFEVIKAFEKAAGKKVPYEIVGRRTGDPASYYASVNKAKRLIGWQTKKTLEEACADIWRWQSKNPNGYK